MREVSPRPTQSPSIIPLVTRRDATDSDGKIRLVVRGVQKCIWQIVHIINTTITEPKIGTATRKENGIKNYCFGNGLDR